MSCSFSTSIILDISCARTFLFHHGRSVFHENSATRNLYSFVFYSHHTRVCSHLQGCNMNHMPMDNTFILQSNNIQKEYYNDSDQFNTFLNMCKNFKISFTLPCQTIYQWTKNEEELIYSFYSDEIYVVFVSNKSQILIHRCRLHHHP